MARPYANRHKGYLRPDSFEDAPLICVTLSIPDVLEIRSALRAQIFALAKSGKWEYTSDANWADLINYLRQTFLDSLVFHSSDDCEALMPEFRVVDCELQWRPTSEDDWIDLVDLTECFPAPSPQTLIRANTSGCGSLEQSLDGGTSYTPITNTGFYRLDAFCPADLFYAKNSAARLQLNNASDVQKLALGIVGSQNELDTRESALLVRYGAGSTNNRQIYLNADGTVQFATTVLTPKGFVDIYMPASSTHGLHVEGRTGLNTGKAVLHLSSLNQSGGSNDGDAIFIQGVNDAAYTLAPGIFIVDRYGNVKHGASRINRQLSTATAKVTRNALLEDTVLLNESGANYQSAAHFYAYKDGTALSSASLTIKSSTSGEAMAGFNGASSVTIDVGTIDCKGNNGIFQALNALFEFGLITGDITLGDLPVIAGNRYHNPALFSAINAIVNAGIATDETSEGSICDDPDLADCLTPGTGGACDLDKCGYAEVTARWFSDQIWATVTFLAGRSDIEASDLERASLSTGRTDVQFGDYDAFFTYVSTIWSLFHTDGGDLDPLNTYIAEGQDFILSAVFQNLYCRMDDCGFLSAGGWELFLSSIGTSTDAQEKVLMLLECMDVGSMATMIALASHSAYREELTLDCSEILCYDWTALIACDSEDVEILGGSCDTNYSACDGTVLFVALHFHITRVTFSFSMVFEGCEVADSCQIQAIGTSEWHTFTPTAGTNDISLTIDAPDGIYIQIDPGLVEGETCCVEMHNLVIYGIGDPVPVEAS